MIRGPFYNLSWCISVSQQGSFTVLRRVMLKQHRSECSGACRAGGQEDQQTESYNSPAWTVLDGAAVFRESGSQVLQAVCLFEP